MSDAMRVFVASSSEQVAVAREAADALRSPRLEPKVWDEETFDFSASYIESLEKELERADFAVVILTADDFANVRKKKVNLPRDNVIFELGLFIGRLGRERCFFVVEAKSATQVASDLSGVKPVNFHRDGAGPERPGLEAQMHKLRSQILQHEPRYKPSREMREEQAAVWRFSARFAGHWWERIRAGEDDKSAISYMTVVLDEVTNTPRLTGSAYDLQGKFLAEWESVITGVLLGNGRPKLHYRWQGTHEEQHAQTYGGGGYIEFDDETQLNTGKGYFYDTNFAQIGEGAHTRVKHFGLYRCDAADVEIMKRSWSEEAKALIRARMAGLRGR